MISSQSMEKEAFLAARFEALGVVLNDRQIGQFIRYAQLLAEWNEKINLTAITAFEDVAVKHFADSCAPVMFPDLAKKLENAAVADIGSGAGFPGIPLKILFPSMKLTMMDSLAKRIRFLELVCGELGLEAACVHGRAEDLAKEMRFREAFDVAAARAVAPMRILSEYCLPFVREDGLFLAYKTAQPEDELAQAERALKVLGGGEVQVLRFVLPETDYGRSLILVSKQGKTPGKYPRKAGTAARNPL